MHPPLEATPSSRRQCSEFTARALRSLRVPGIALLAAGLILPPLCAQPTTKQPPAASPTPTHKSTHARHAAAPTAPADPAPEAQTPAPPPQPKWPAYDQPVQATVVWDSHGLSIDAANSSLTQILKDVSTATGVDIQGVNADQRVFGTFGPGSARDVLGQVLQGSGYNVIMVGDQGQGVPRELLLSTRQGNAQQAANRSTPAPVNNMNNDDDDTPDDVPIQQEPPIMHPGYQPGAPPRSPQQILQEMQQRQQQQQQQPGQPPN